MLKKKLLLLLFVIGIGFMVSGATCQNFQQGQDAVEQFICDPPANVVSLAVAADPFIQMGLSAGLPVALPAYQAATAILSNGTACATVKQVNALIDFMESTFFTKAVAKKMKVKATLVAFDTAPLKAWLKAKGK